MPADIVPTAPGGARVRASNTEREHVAAVLRAAATEGMLTLDEVDERLAAAYAATYRSDLQPLTWDLPGHGRELAAVTPEGQREVRSARTRLVRHAGAVALLSALLVAIWALSGAPYFWPIWPIGFLVLTVVKHARWVGVGGPPVFHGGHARGWSPRR